MCVCICFVCVCGTTARVPSVYSQKYVSEGGFNVVYIYCAVVCGAVLCFKNYYTVALVSRCVLTVTRPGLVLT